MKSNLWLVADPPPLSQEAAHELLDFLHQFIAILEQHYPHPPAYPPPFLEPDQPDLFEDLDDSDPPF